jgi:ferrochelatase
MSYKTKILLVNLGSPKSPSVKDVKSYLREFLGNPKLVNINPLIWKIILNFFILPFRPKSSAKLYQRIWDGSGFPLTKYSNEFCEKLNKQLGHKFDIQIVFSVPRVSLDKYFHNQTFEKNEKVFIIPLFPQYSNSTTGLIIDDIEKLLLKNNLKINPIIIKHFYHSLAFINNSVELIEESLKRNPSEHLVLSFHGIPKISVTKFNDPYYEHCLQTYSLIKERVKSIKNENIHISFQSRLGRQEWLGPYTDNLVNSLTKNKAHISIYCPSFVSDCLETLDEIGYELKSEITSKNSECTLIPCLNTKSSWVNSFAELIERQVEIEKDQLDEKIVYPIVKIEKMQEQEQDPSKLTPSAKKTIKIIFLTLFLDLVGFSIIFPLFPELAKHYLEVDGNNFFLNFIFDSMTSLIATTGAPIDKLSGIVLFGGALGALYSLLQFIAAPLWGIISDRVGRKPVLLISVFGLAISYLLWIFSASFTLLIAARFIGGIMGGNISTATAVIADITNAKTRSKGMAFIGIAFALGFILGPALGGLLSKIDLTIMYPELVKIGINPFSTPAILAMLLSLINLYLLKTKFTESLPLKKRGKGKTFRSSNVFYLIKPLPFKGVNLTNFSYFVFLSSFSGIEFTLTFLAVERLKYTPIDNAFMFIFIGIVLALVQGGIVQRKASKVGEKKMATWGIFSTIPGLIIIANAFNSEMLYLGLFFLAVGSSMTIPCLTALASLYLPAEEQGRGIGIFRSLGALARVIGPILASIIYWYYGTSFPYYLGALFLVIPIALILKLPKINQQLIKV